MITFKVETWDDLARDGGWIFPLHFDEIALDKDLVSINIDHDRYREMEKLGRLLVLVMRNKGYVIGYYIAIIVPHLHYKTSLHSSTDMFYLLPEFRKGTAGVRLLAEAEKALKERGVVRAYISSKLKMDHTKILQWLGWTPTDTVMSKVLA